jgi:PhzF family phenazine biosynthesis protein
MMIYQVDAFTDAPFRGNPAGVCLLDQPRSAEWMREVAAEMNLSETAFLHRTGDRYALRWFTPRTEVSLCGHATLASAHILWEAAALGPEAPACFDTLSGPLTATTSGGWIEMDFPARTLEPADPVEPVNEALAVQPRQTWRRVTEQGPMYLLELGSEEEVRSLAPDYRALRASGARAVIATARSTTAGFDFVSRFFAPAVGIDEDPVTGSAHCYLAPHWARKLGKTDLVGYQASARGGVVGCGPRGERVVLRGQAVTTLRGELLA